MTTDCASCDKLRYRIAVEHDFTVAVPCPACSTECAVCHGERTVLRQDEKGYDVLVPCRCAGLHNRLACFNGARIPARYRHCTMASYNPSHAQSDSYLAIVRHLDRYAPGGRGLLLTGPVGTGKTHLVVSILRDFALEKAMRVRFVEFTHLLAEIKEGYNQGRGEAELLGPLSRVPVLAVDELGKGLVTDWQLAMLDELISRRYNAGLSTYFTTNMATTEQTPRFDEPVGRESGNLRRALETVQLIDRVGERIFSRLHEMCDVVRIEGADYRRRGAAA